MNNILKKIIISLFLFLLVFPANALAYEVTYADDMPVEGDFVLGPGKNEIFLAPGENASRDIKITNRTGKMITVKIDIEDFTGDAAYSTRLLGEERGPYSLKDYLIPEKRQFNLAHGERATLPIAINIPENAEPGGLYGAAIVRVEPVVETEGGQKENVEGQINITSRLASLFFVKIKGDAKEEGALKSFATDKKFYQKSGVNFVVSYENTGNIHLNPYAKIEIKNILGKKIDEIDQAPWFVMPGFTRTRNIEWDKTLTLGRYTATLNLNRGYGNVIDTAQVSFWIVPVKALVVALIVIVMIATFMWWFSNKFEIKRK